MSSGVDGRTTLRQVARFHPAFAEEFLAPLPLLAVAVMAVNDAWLKPEFHNAITGKLSDFAIATLLPLYFSALIGLGFRCSLQRRLLLGLSATVAIFIPLKTSTAALSAYLSLMEWIGVWLGRAPAGSVVDPTDLIALFASPLTILVAGKKRSAPATAVSEAITTKASRSRSVL